MVRAAHVAARRWAVAAMEEPRRRDRVRRYRFGEGPEALVLRIPEVPSPGGTGTRDGGGAGPAFPAPRPVCFRCWTGSTGRTCGPAPWCWPSTSGSTGGACPASGCWRYRGQAPFPSVPQLSGYRGSIPPHPRDGVVVSGGRRGEPARRGGC